MNKKMRELQAQIVDLMKSAEGYMAEGEGHDLAKAEETLDKIDELQKELDLAARMEDKGKITVPADIPEPGAADGFKAFTKFVNGERLADAEKALITGADSVSGEGYLIPEDVKTAINELRKTYLSARSLVNVVTTQSLTGSINYESGTPAGLTAFDDGDTIATESNPTFIKKTWTIGFHGKLIPISRILLGAERAGLMTYLNQWFVRNAIITENSAIFTTLKSGYNSGTPKAVAGWEALKKSINVDLDPSCLIGGHIVTNQSGFACLDEEVDGNGRPILTQNPTNPTQKLFQGLPIVVFPDAQLANIDTTHFPVFYGNTQAGAMFVEHSSLQFALSEHAGFSQNQNILRVIEGFTTLSTDGNAYIYGSLTATA